MPIQIIWYSNYENIFISNVGVNWYNIESFMRQVAASHQNPYIIKKINFHEIAEGEAQSRYDEATIRDIYDVCDNFDLNKFNNLWQKAI